MNSGNYPLITLPYKEYGSITDFCRAINRRISARKNGAFHFNYSMEQGKIYISSPLDNEKVFFNDNLKHILGFKHNIINGRNAGSVSGM